MALSFAAGVVCTLAVLLSFSLTSRVNAAPQQRYPEMHAALRHLEQARDALTNAAHDFRGHRAKALEHTGKAIEEVNKAIEVGE
jgi:CHASE3 domain sensor protein